MDRLYEGRGALITGASAGLGAAFAEALAARGAHVALAARRVDRLEALTARLAAAHGVRAVAVPADLSDRAAPEAMMRTLATRDFAVDILINNAGFAQPGEYHETDWRGHSAYLDLMVGAYAGLARLALPSMQEKGWGRIVNVASLAGLTPGAARHTLYGPSKAFLIKLSESLAAENAARGVRVSALCPGLTRTEFHDVNGARAVIDGLPRFMVMETGPVVDSALKALERGKVVYVPGRFNKVVALAVGALPRPVAASLARRGAARVRRRA